MLQILNNNKFINDHKWKEVTNVQSFDKQLAPTPDGLYSHQIFGTSKQEQFQNYGYINLGTRILHPLIYKNIGNISGIFKKILTKAIKVKIVAGEVIPVSETETGWTGIKDLYNNWDKIDFKKFDEKNSRVKSLIDYLIKVDRNLIFDDKIMVIPVNFRQAVYKNGLMHEDELSGLYKSLLGMNTDASARSDYMQSLLNLTDKTSIIQNRVNEIYDYLIKFLEKKDGLFRTSLIGKRQNNVARLVANAQPTIPIDCVALPWQACLNIFDIAIIGMINADPFHKEYMKKLELVDLSSDDIADMFGFIYHNVDIYSKSNPDKVTLWQDLILDTFNFHTDIKCFLKRDPAWDKGSYHLLQPIINTDNEFACIINSMLYNPLGGDSFSTNYTAQEVENGLVSRNEYGELRVPNGSSYFIKSMQKIYSTI